MATPAVSSMAFLPGVVRNESKVPARRTYRTTKSFVAVEPIEAKTPRCGSLNDHENIKAPATDPAANASE